MRIEFAQADFSLNNGFYYTPIFKMARDLLTIQVDTNGVSTITVESSIDGNYWYAVPSCEFVTELTGGLQSYVECQTDLMYRIKSTLLPTKLILLL